jgi:hypothetical protein
MVDRVIEKIKEENYKFIVGIIAAIFISWVGWVSIQTVCTSKDLATLTVEYRTKHNMLVTELLEIKKISVEIREDQLSFYKKEADNWKTKNRQ